MSQLPTIGPQMRVPASFFQQQFNLPTGSGIEQIGRGISQAGIQIGGALERVRLIRNRRRSAELDVENVNFLSKGFQDAIQMSLESEPDEVGAFYDQQIESRLDTLREIEDGDLREEAITRFSMSAARTGATLRSSLVQREGDRMETAHEAFVAQADRAVAKGAVSVDDAMKDIDAKLQDGVGVYTTPEAAKLRSSQIRRELEVSASDFERAELIDLSTDLSDAVVLAEPAQQKIFRNTFERSLNVALKQNAITHQQRSRLLAQFDASVQAKVLEDVQSVERRAVDYSASEDLAKLGLLEEEITDLARRHPFQRVKDAVVDVQERMKKSGALSTDTERFLSELADPTKVLVSANDAVLDSAVKAAGPQTAALLGSVLAKVGRVPPEIRRRMKADGNRATLNLPRFLQHVGVIDTHSRSVAEREAEAANDLGETAYYAVRDIADPVERDLRMELLSRENAGSALDTAGLMLGRGGTVKEREEVGDTRRMQKALKALDPFPFTPFPFPLRATEIGNLETSWMNRLFEFHMVSQMLGSNKPAKEAVSLAEKAAVSDFLGANTRIDVARGITVTSHYIPKQLLNLKGGFSEAAATTQIEERLVAIMGELSEPVFAAANGVLDPDGRRSHIPIYDQGLVGYITWDSTEGTALFTSRGGKPEEFRRISSIYGASLGPRPIQQHGSAHLRPGQTLFEMDQTERIVDIAINRYATTHDGGRPPSQEDPEFLSILSEVIREASE